MGAVLLLVPAHDEVLVTVGMVVAVLVVAFVVELFCDGGLAIVFVVVEGASALDEDLVDVIVDLLEGSTGLESLS